MKYSVPSNSIVEKGASVDEGTHIWYFVHVREGAKIGKDCNIGNGCYIGKKVVIGDRVRIGNNVSLYEGMIVKDGVVIGNNATFTNVRWPSPRRKAQYFQNTIIEEDAYVGANSTVVAGVHIGQEAHIAEGALIVRDVPPKKVMGGRVSKIIETNLI